MKTSVTVSQPVEQRHDVRLELSSSIEFMGPLMSFFYALLKNKGMEEAVISNVVTAIIEAVANAITHGNQSNLAKKTTILVALGDRTLQVEVHDEGNGFDLAAVPDPLAPENLMSLSGRGIFLIKSFMDSVDFDFSGTGTRLVMGKAFEACGE